MNVFNYGDEDDIFVGENRFYSFSKAAKIIGKKGLGRNNLLALLREKGILDKWNHPMDDFKYKCFFRIKDNRHETPTISTYGINYIKKNLL